MKIAGRAIPLTGRVDESVPKDSRMSALQASTQIRRCRAGVHLVAFREYEVDEHQIYESQIKPSFGLDFVSWRWLMLRGFDARSFSWPLVSW